MGRIVGALLCVGMLALLGIATISSCYSPPNPACGFLCNADNSFNCPDNYSCARAAGVCVSSSAPAGMRCFADAAPAPEGIDADPTPPTVIDTLPANGDANVARNTQIQVIFSQAIAGYDTSTVHVTDGGNPVAVSLSFEQVTNILRITPLTQLGGGSSIQVTLSGITNANPLHVPLGDYSFAFTTIDDSPPQLILSSPLDMSTAVAVSSTIVITFSEPVLHVDTTSFAVLQSATVLPGVVTSNGDGTVWTYTPGAALPAASLITVLLDAAITDITGNALTPTMFSFTTQ